MEHKEARYTLHVIEHKEVWYTLLVMEQQRSPVHLTYERHKEALHAMKQQRSPVHLTYERYKEARYTLHMKDTKKPGTPYTRRNILELYSEWGARSLLIGTSTNPACCLFHHVLSVGLKKAWRRRAPLQVFRNW